MSCAEEHLFAFLVNGDERRAEITIEVIVRGKALRGISADETPLGPEGALPLLHKIILSSVKGTGIAGYRACGGNKTFAPFSPLSTGTPGLKQRSWISKGARSKKQANWDELDTKDYATKAAVVALMEKSVADAEDLKRVPDASLEVNIEPWIGVLEHSAEHYGLLVGYYRANGLVPPASRPAK